MLGSREKRVGDPRSSLKRLLGTDSSNLHGPLKKNFRFSGQVTDEQAAAQEGFLLRSQWWDLPPSFSFFSFLPSSRLSFLILSSFLFWVHIWWCSWIIPSGTQGPPKLNWGQLPGKASV